MTAIFAAPRNIAQDRAALPHQQKSPRSSRHGQPPDYETAKVELSPNSALCRPSAAIRPTSPIASGSSSSPLLPGPPRGPAGRKPKHDKREIVNAILYQVRAGGAWRMLPGDLPPWQTVYGYFRDWGADGTLERLHDALRERVRTKQDKRNPEPSAGIVDSQSVKGADTVCAATRGYDAAKKINGRKRHIVVDTIGLLLVVMVSAASIQDRDGGRALLRAHD